MENTEFKKFSEKTIREIRWWAWAGAVIPLTGLAGFFFIWSFGTASVIHLTMVIGATTMFGVAVGWWWWALRAISILVKHWDQTGSSVAAVLEDIKEVKQLVREVVVETDSSNR